MEVINKIIVVVFGGMLGMLLVLAVFAVSGGFLALAWNFAAIPVIKAVGGPALQPISWVMGMLASFFLTFIGGFFKGSK